VIQLENYFENFLVTIAETINNNIEINHMFQMKKIRRLLNVDPDNRSFLSFLYKALRILEKNNYIQFVKRKQRNYYVLLEKIDLQQILKQDNN